MKYRGEGGGSPLLFPRVCEKGVSLGAPFSFSQ